MLLTFWETRYIIALNHPLNRRNSISSNSFPKHSKTFPSSFSIPLLINPSFTSPFYFHTIAKRNPLNWTKELTPPRKNSETTIRDVGRRQTSPLEVEEGFACSWLKTYYWNSREPIHPAFSPDLMRHYVFSRRACRLKSFRWRWPLTRSSNES